MIVITQTPLLQIGDIRCRIEMRRMQDSRVFRTHSGNPPYRFPTPTDLVNHVENCIECKNGVMGLYTS